MALWVRTWDFLTNVPAVREGGGSNPNLGNIVGGVFHPTRQLYLELVPRGEAINRPIQSKCVASVTNCGLGLVSAMSPIVNRGWQLLTNDKYGKSFSKLFHIIRRLRLVFQLNACVFPKDLTQYLSEYNPMIERTDLSR